ncbi:ORF6N domain-containing protein [Anaerovorax odorimutans]|uniref:ORF6N domain-containing protein n=1 Tax=Anaerovorax odorimutans TaxID=109327 RepID=A0ABT1RR79_9FIRM|nr:ORF6N domain-containing protein [Anaerovorax odorimutans]MCQ4637700.1 ORF6N domain-containing protein [Anaerovorax odorimutans]
MKTIKVRGRQDFMGHEIPVVLGGFGEDTKCISDKTIAEIHEMKIKHVRELLNRNKRRFALGVDAIDLKGVVQNGTLDKCFNGVDGSYISELLWGLGYSKQAVTQAEHIYILSERGYAKLIKIMDTDLAWEIHDHLIDEYFAYKYGKTAIAKEYETKATSLGEIASYTREMDKRMEKEGAPPWKICEAFKMISEQFGIELPDDFVKIPEFEQLKINNITSK